jgi:acyl homoserine lactone synthase
MNTRIREPNMATICLAWDTIHLHGEAWISHHRLRHRAFVERQGWDVPSCRGIEYDSFDTPEARYVLWSMARARACGSGRLIPTQTRPSCSGSSGLDT